jgi:hypothetical protein
MDQDENEGVTSKPPPVILYGISDVGKLYRTTKEIINIDTFTFKIITTKQLRVTTLNAEV